jgi:hypothetical protein
LITFIHTWKGEVKWVEQAVPAEDTAPAVGTVWDALAEDTVSAAEVQLAADTASAETHLADIVPEAAALEEVRLAVDRWQVHREAVSQVVPEDREEVSEAVPEDREAALEDREAEWEILHRPREEVRRHLRRGDEGVDAVHSCLLYLR